MFSGAATMFAMPAPPAARIRSAAALSRFWYPCLAIRSAVTAEATGTIGYGIPCFKHNGALVWFAGFSEHRSLFPTASVIEAFKKELKNFHTSKGTIAILRIHRSLFSMELPRTLKLVIGKFCNW